MERQKDRGAEEFYKNPENERAFQEWLAQRQREQEQEAKIGGSG